MHVARWHVPPRGKEEIEGEQLASGLGARRSNDDPLTADRILDHLTASRVSRAFEIHNLLDRITVRALGTSSMMTVPSETATAHYWYVRKDR
jgi:hypothetical protein